MLGVRRCSYAFGSLNAVHGDVLYLALEDGKRRLQRRLDKLLPTFSGEWAERLTLVPMGGWHRADQGGLEDIGAWCKSVPKPVLVVVDTLERIRKPANGKSPLYSADYEAVAGLQKIVLEYGIALVVLHHDRKSDADDAFRYCQRYTRSYRRGRHDPHYQAPAKWRRSVRPRARYRGE
jgi:AAA domain